MRTARIHITALLTCYKVSHKNNLSIWTIDIDLNWWG